MPVGKLTLMAFGWAVVATQPCWAQDRSTMPFQNPEPEKATAAPLTAGANSFAEGQAKTLLESKGFAQVSSLVNGRDGIWRGTAIKDDRKVDVSIDFQGHVVWQ